MVSLFVKWKDNGEKLESFCPILAIKSFILDGNMFFNTFILNWVEKNYPIEEDGDVLHIPQVSAGAQVIDGQHRLEGLKQAKELLYC